MPQIGEIAWYINHSGPCNQKTGGQGRTGGSAQGGALGARKRADIFFRSPPWLQLCNPPEKYLLRKNIPVFCLN